MPFMLFRYRTAILQTRLVGVSMQIKAYKCYLAEYEERGSIINAQSAGKAKDIYFRHLRDPWPEIKFTDIKVKTVGDVVSTEGFENIVRYRRVSNAKIGMRVTVLCGQDGKRSAILVDGGGGGAYFEVIFEDTQERMYVHPAEVEEFRDEQFENECKYHAWLDKLNRQPAVEVS